MLILHEASATDARVSLLETVYVLLTIQFGREGVVPEVIDVVAPRPQVRTNSEICAESWERLDEVDLDDLFLQKIPMLKTCPRFLRGRLRHCFGVALRERHRAKLAGDRVAEVRAWKLFGMVPIMLLRRTKHSGTIGRDELAQRVEDFNRGRWTDFLPEVQQSDLRSGYTECVDDQVRRGAAAMRRVQRGQVSRARHELTGAPLAPKTPETRAELQGRRPQVRQSLIPQEIVDYQPASPLQLDSNIFTKCLRKAPAGSSPGPGGCTNEMLKVCLDDIEILELLVSAAEDFARADTPHEVAKSFMLASMTALQKKDGGVRGIATGTSFRRLVAKTLARQFGAVVEATCSPFQFALSTRAGTDCVGHAVRFATDANPATTVLSIDGVGAYDHVFRSAMFEKLFERENLRGLLPFVRATYLQLSKYKWIDGEGVRHNIEQHEGGEQGDPLMPLLFCLAIHNALLEVQESLLPGEHLFAFLDDIYVLCQPQRTREVYNILAERLFARAGIQLHAGKTRTWNKAGICPPRMEDLGPDVWNPEGIKILGTPVGSDVFVEEFSRVRVQEETKLWEASRVGPRCAVCVADFVAVRWTSLPPFSEDRAACTVCHVREQSRRWNVDSY